MWLLVLRLLVLRWLILRLGLPVVTAIALMILALIGLLFLLVFIGSPTELAIFLGKILDDRWRDILGPSAEQTISAGKLDSGFDEAHIESRIGFERDLCT